MHSLSITNISKDFCHRFCVKSGKHIGSASLFFLYTVWLKKQEKNYTKPSFTTKKFDFSYTVFMPDAEPLRTSDRPAASQ